MIGSASTAGDLMEAYKMTKLKTLAGLTAILLSPVSFAQASDSEIQEMRVQIMILTQRLDELERANHQSNEPPGQTHDNLSGQMAGLHDETLDDIVEAKVDHAVDQAVTEQIEQRLAAVSWAERIRWKGDFRYRYENIDIEGIDDRNRQRIRARAHLEAYITDTMEVGLGLASGGDDPVSTNQTLGGGGSTKDLRIDLAYFDWSGLTDTHILGGKVKNFLVRTGKNGLLWDTDWRPEGAGINWNNGRFFAHGLGTWIESDSNKGQEFSWIAQAGAQFALGNAARLKIGGGYAQFDTKGSGSFFGDDNDFFGNSFDPETLSYIYNYHEVEAFAELSFGLGEKPVMLFGDYVVNTAAEENDTAYAFGFKFGNAKSKGTWELGYIYQKLEADSVLGLVTDSDFGGGGTDARGSIFKGTYAFHDNWNARFIYFLNEINLASGDPGDFDRLQLDLNFKYK
jgi:hypothetical protein